jgi:orotidine-5'-phosphate decarboxylase
MDLITYLKEIVSATAEHAASFKPNVAFFEALGTNGMSLFSEVVQHIRMVAPDALIIADAKRGDLGNTARFYAKAFFEVLDCDAVTVNPYMGRDSVEPFAQYKDKAVILLCLTSNQGAMDFQHHGNPPLYLQVASRADEWNQEWKNLWLVVGATRGEEEIASIRKRTALPLLIPGVGAQGGDLKTVIRTAGTDVLINASRSIMYAAKEGESIRIASERAARDLREEINREAGL